jgi:hypothetical protein
MFLRFYEWNLFGFAREGTYSRADKTQAHLVACHHDGTAGEVTYPAHGVDLFATPRADRVDLRLRVENRTGRDWGPAAGLVPCLNPGRTPTDDPVTPELADRDRQHTYYWGPGGVEPLTDGRLHWHADYEDHVAAWRPDGGFPVAGSPYNEEAPGAVAEPLVVRESDDGEWVTGVGWEAGLSVDAHNGWQCIHLGVPVGPLPAGETAERRGALYLRRGDRDDVLARHRATFG